MLRLALFNGIAFTAMGLLGVTIDEGPSGLRNILDFRGTRPNLEPIKRASYHLSILFGWSCLVFYALGWLLVRIAR